MTLLVGLYFVGAFDIGAVDFDPHALQGCAIDTFHIAFNGSGLPKREGGKQEQPGNRD